MELTEERIAKLIEDIRKHPDKYSEEAKFILFLTRYEHRGAMFSYSCNYEVLTGDVKEIILRERHENIESSPWKDEYEVALIPLEVPTIILVRGTRWQDGGDYELTEELYVFDGESWKYMKIREI